MHALLSHKEVNLTEKILFNQEEAYFKNLLLPKSRHYINFILFLYLPGSNLLNLTLTITITHVTKPGQILIFLFQYKYGSNTVEVIDLRKTPSTRTGLFSEQPESGKYADFEARFLLTSWSSKVETTMVDVRAWQSQRLRTQTSVSGILKSTGGFKAAMPFQNALGFQKFKHH